MRLALRYFNRNDTWAVNYFVSSYCAADCAAHAVDCCVSSSFDYWFDYCFDCFAYCDDIFGKKRDSSVTVPFIIVR